MLPTTAIKNSGSGPQNVAAGSGDQFSQNGNGPQINNCTRYYVAFQDLQNEESKRLRDEKEKEACLRSLVFGAIDVRRHDIVVAEDGTCEWLFSTTEFREWQQPTHLASHNGVLWIKGKPGAGKSTLMKYTLLQCQNSLFHDHAVAAYFFNARGEALEKSPIGMLRSIVYQLIREHKTLYESFVPVLREKQRISQEGNYQWRASELKEFIRSASKLLQPRPLFLLVDALDECNDFEVREVVSFLESLSISAARDKVPLKIYLSSRHYPKISMNKVLEVVVETNKGHQTDITRYITRTLQECEADLGTEIERRAGGIFLWVVLVVTLLNKAYDEGRVEAMRKTLEEIPDGLEEMFSTILSKEVSESTETVRMLQWVLLSRRPLKAQELFAAAVGTALPADDVIQRRITHSSKGLIEVRGRDADSVHFIHLSVSDFLFRQNRLQMLDPTLGLEAVMIIHGRLWACCWSCIGQVDMTVTNLQAMKELKRKNQFLEYAASHMFDHAESALAKGKTSGPDQSQSELTVQTTVDTSTHLSIQRWIQEANSWFPWWKTFLIATGSAEERSDLRKEEEAQLLYIFALRGLPKLCLAVLPSANANAQSGKYGSALQAASYQGHEEIVQLLLDNGADVNTQGGEYGNALYIASYQGYQEIVQLLLEKGADVNAQSGKHGSALQAASYQGYQGIVQLLLDKGADVNMQGGEYGSALQAASASFDEHKEMVQLLLDKGTDINAQGGEYGSALQAASYQGHEEIVQLLLDNGADVNTQGGDYGNALYIASYERHQDIVLLLLDKSADVNAQSGKHGSALQAASYQGYQKIVQLLLKMVADANAQGSRYGDTLQNAAIPHKKHLRNDELEVKTDSLDGDEDFVQVHTQYTETQAIKSVISLNLKPYWTGLSLVMGSYVFLSLFRMRNTPNIKQSLNIILQSAVWDKLANLLGGLVPTNR